MTHFLLYSEGKLVDRFDTLDEAKNGAVAFIKDGHAVRIESFVAPAPSEFWRYDTEVYDWVHLSQGY